MKKFFLRLLLTVTMLFLAVYIVNSETDFFKAFDTNYPKVSQNVPGLSAAMNGVYDAFSKLPTIWQIKEHITKEKMPVSPDTIAENAYIKDSPLLMFYENESIGITVNDDKTFTLFGVLTELAHSNLIVRLKSDDGKVVSETDFGTDTAFEFSKTIKIPETSHDKLWIEVFTGERKYGDYIGWVNDYIFISKNQDKWELGKSPVEEHNQKLFTAPRSTSKALKATELVQSDNNSIISVANQLTADCNTDYEKIKKFHDWICTYLHYDNDSLSKSHIAPHSATDVLKSRKAVCIGYANLYAALCRSVDIPCYVVTGYALGISSGSDKWTKKIVEGNEENHAWNEAYVDGRWVIIDSTWDTYNSYENGEMKKGSQISHLYFDSNIDFFGMNHKIMHYE